MLFLADKNFDDEDSVDGNRPSSASSSTSSKTPANSRRVGMGTTRRLGSAPLGSKSSSKLIAYMNLPLCKVYVVFTFQLISWTFGRCNSQIGPEDPVIDYPPCETICYMCVCWNATIIEGHIANSPRISIMRVVAFVKGWNYAAVHWGLWANHVSDAGCEFLFFIAAALQLDWGRLLTATC